MDLGLQTHEETHEKLKALSFKLTDYQKVAKNIAGIKIPPIEKNLKAKKHIGATGNLGLDALKRQIDSEKKSIEAEKKEFESAIKKLIHTNQ